MYDHLVLLLSYGFGIFCLTRLHHPVLRVLLYEMAAVALLDLGIGLPLDILALLMGYGVLCFILVWEFGLTETNRLEMQMQEYIGRARLLELGNDDVCRVILASRRLRRLFLGWTPYVKPSKE